MKKKTIWLVALMATVAFYACSQHDPESDFRVGPESGGNSVRIIEYVGDRDNWTVRIPPRIRGLPVTHIGEEVFRDSNLITVIIPNTVTYIGAGAFRNSNLTSVTIPNNVTHIGADAFANNQLTSVTIGNSVTEIGSSAFANNQLTSVTIPASVTNMGIVPFYGSPGLTAINVAPNNPSFSSANGVLFNRDGTTLLQWPAGRSDSIVIPNTVTTIGRSAFNGLQLTSITIPNNVTEIGIRAFRNNRLTNVTIPNSVTIIGERAFAENDITSITIPQGVTLIEDLAFAHNPLTSVTFASNMVTLRPFSFGLYRWDIGANEVNRMFIRGDLSMGASDGEEFVNTNLAQLYAHGGAGTYWRIVGSPYWLR